MNKEKQIKQIESVLEWLNEPDRGAIEMAVIELKELKEAITVKHCCTELNNCFELHEHVIYQGVDMMITFVDNCQKTANLYCSCDKTNWLGVSLNKLNKIS